MKYSESTSISKEQFEKLIDFLKNDTEIRENRRDRLLKLFSLLYYTGARLNELTNLTNNMMASLLIGEGFYIKRPTNEESKRIYISENAKSILNEIFTEQIFNDELIFISERGDKKSGMNTNSILRDTNSYLEKVFKDESIRTHSFRCAFIKELLDDNVNVKLIQELTGHKSASSIYRYIQNRNIDLSSILNSIR
jgi:site-specific recombinase XerD